MVVPIIEEIASERPDIKVGKINVDEQPELASEFGYYEYPDFGGDEEWKDCSTGFGCKTQGGHSNNDLRRCVYGSFRFF